MKPLGSCLAKVAITAAMVAAAVPAGAAGGAASGFDAHVDAPVGFETLDEQHEAVVDLFFGGRKIGETRIVQASGTVRFFDPARIAAMIPNVADPQTVANALSGDLQGNEGRACSALGPADCGRLSPDVAAIIHDQDRFRIDLFVNPKFLKTIAAVESDYLAVPAAGLSLTDSVGAALSGSGGSSPDYNVQNRTILALRNGRIRSDTSYSSGLGLVVDNLVGEVDRPGMRYSAGMFWAPGLDLTGRRRIIGIGAATQFDTRSDRDSLAGTPLLLFLQQPAQVEMVIDGRLAGSRLYQAGNNALDTSALPDGAYTILLRIREPGGEVREERRFFVKNAQVAPLGQPINFAYLGVLADAREHRLISPTKRLFYQVGTARRLSRAFALDAAVIGTDRTAIAEAGAFLITPVARVRVAGLVSVHGDRGGLAQLTSAGNGPLSLSFDVRRIWSGKGGPLLPLPGFSSSFDGGAPTAAQLGNGSYTQASGSIGYRLGTAYLSILGSLRHDAGLRSDYSIGPSFSWAIVQRGAVQLTFNADAQRTRETTSAFAGLRLQAFFNRLSVVGRAGEALRSQRGADGGDRSRVVGSLSADWTRDGGDRTQLSVGAGVDRSLESTTARASAAAFTDIGSLRGDVLHDFNAETGATQYSLSLQSGVAVSLGGAAWGGRDIAESAVIAGVEDAPDDATFDVLVNDGVRGRIHGRERLPIFLEPYRAYSVRIVPVAAPPMNFDGIDRRVVLYPGNVQAVRWKAQRLFTVFGQSLRPDGTPVAGARVETSRGVGETDDRGYFQVDVASADQLLFTLGDGTSCRASISGIAPKDSYAALGKVICR